MNHFVGFPVRLTPSEFWASLPPLPDAYRAFAPHDLHFTIAFFGNCGEARARHGFASIEPGNVNVIDVRFARVEPMGNPRRHSALSATLLDGRAQIESLIEGWRDRLCDEAGAPRDAKKPIAHMTIARPRRKASADERRGGLDWAKSCDLSGWSARIDAVALYGWASDRRGRLFEILEEKRFART